jgi:hypothetical protein
MAETIAASDDPLGIGAAAARARDIHKANSHSKPNDMVRWVGAEIDRFSPSIGEHLLAFQQPKVIDVISRVTSFRGCPEKFFKQCSSRQCRRAERNWVRTAFLLRHNRHPR